MSMSTEQSASLSLSLLFSSLYYIGISHTMYSVYTQHTVHVDLMHPLHHNAHRVHVHVDLTLPLSAALPPHSCSCCLVNSSSQCILGEPVKLYCRRSINLLSLIYLTMARSLGNCVGIVARITQVLVGADTCEEARVQ